MLKEGIKGTQTVKVTDALSAKTMGSGDLDVYATPAMVALFEKAASLSVAPFLEEGTTTVGISLNIKHSAASPVGANIVCESLLTAVDGRKLTFEVKAFDDCGEIGSGVHERFIVKSESFTAKAYAKLSAREK